MITLIFCLHRLPGMSRDEFQTYWRETHAPLVKSFAPVTGIKRYVQHHTFSHPALEGAITARGGPEAYDGVAQLSWESLEKMLAIRATPEARNAGRMMLEDEKKFIDLARSPIFFLKENIVVG